MAAPTSPVLLTFCPLLLLPLQQLEVVLFLMASAPQHLAKVPCHHLHVNIHYTYLSLP